MPFAPRFGYTDSLVASLLAVEHARATLKILSLPPDASVRLTFEARRQSTRASVAIEGNDLTDEQLRRAIASQDPSRTQGEQEVRNYWRALDRVDDFARAGQRVSESFIQELHRLVMVRERGRRGSRSPYRTEECPVVDSLTRRIEYGTPVPKDVPFLMRELVEWLNGEAALQLATPVRAGLFLHRFLSIHPFPDGNGRTGRLLTTCVLWSGSYSMRGFFSFDEHFEADRDRYYRSLQMGLPVNFYTGRHDPEHTPWLQFFLEVLARAALNLEGKAGALHRATGDELSRHWDSLSRLQQQLLTRWLNRRTVEGSEDYLVRPTEAEDWFGVSSVTARDWLKAWVEDGFLEPHYGSGGLRITAYRLRDPWRQVLEQVAQAGWSI